MLLLGGASAQQVSVRGYHLTSGQEVSVSRPETGWTYFQIPEGKDTIYGTADTIPGVENLLWDYLYADADPEALTTAYAQKPGNAIGFDFPFAGKTMKCFGITGNGALFLGAEDTVTAWYRTGFNMSDSNIVWLMPRLMNRGYPVTTQDWVVAADAQTRIGYHNDAANGVLWIAFENLLLPANGQVYRWSYDVLLHENGDIQVDFRDVETMEPTPDDRNSDYFGFSFAIKAHNGESAVYAADWDADLAATNKALVMESAHADATLTAIYPQPCTAPEGVTAETGLSLQLATDLTVNLTLEGSYDGLVAILADNDQVTDRPEDGKTYVMDMGTFQKGDSIGDYLVRLSELENSFSATGLQAATAYYVYVWPYNDRCLDGPKYAREPLVLPVSTLAGPPAVHVEDVAENAAILNFEGLSESAEVVVGIARRDYGATNRVLDINEKDWGKGDTLYHDSSAAGSTNRGPYLIEVAYSGRIENNSLTLEGLEASTPYYLYVWNKTGERVYTTQYSAASFHTIGTVGKHSVQEFSFENDRIPATSETGVFPAGWTYSEEAPAVFALSMPRAGNRREDSDKSLAVSMVGASVGEPVWADAITPAFRLDYQDVNLKYRVQRMYRSAMAQWQEGDTLTVSYRKVGEEQWQEVSKVSMETALTYEEDNFAPLSAQIQDLTVGDEYQIRFRMSGIMASRATATNFLLNRLEIEPALPCSYPVDIVVNDSLTTHHEIGLDFANDNLLESDIIFRAREVGEAEWSDWKQSSRNDRCLVERLNANTAYEVALQAVCSADSSLVQVVEASTMRGLPYAKDLTNLSAVPEDFGLYISTALPEEGHADLVENSNYAVMVPSGDSTYNTLGVPLSSSQYVWVVFPALCLEDVMAPAEYSFVWKAYTRQYGEDGKPAYEKYPGAALAYVLLSPDDAFSAADIVDTLMFADTMSRWQKCVLDLSAYSRQFNVAVAVHNPDVDYDFDAQSCFVMDSLRAAYTEGVPCFAVEDVRQYGLEGDQITLSWYGTSWEYAIYLNNLTLEKVDTIYTAESEYTITGLEPGCEYEYSIQSFCESGHQSPGPVVSDYMFYFETDEACTTPTGFALIDSTWQSVTAVAHSNVEKQLHVWAADTERYPQLDYYFPWAASVDTLVADGLFDELHIRYHAAVRSLCSDNPEDATAWSDTLTFTTPQLNCAAPANLQEVLTSTSAELSWSAGEENDAYRLVWSPVSGEASDTLDVQQTTYSLTDLEPKTAYAWSVQGVCANRFYSAWASAEFTTEDVSNEASAQARFAVRTMQNRIMILNPGLLPIDRVEAYTAAGKLLYAQEFGISDNVLLPVLSNTSEMLLIRIVSEGKSEVYKVVQL